MNYTYVATCMVGLEKLLGEEIDIKAGVESLKYTSGAKFFDPLQNDVFPRADFPLCTDVDRFGFVMRLVKGGEAECMERVDI